MTFIFVKVCIFIYSTRLILFFIILEQLKFALWNAECNRSDKSYVERGVNAVASVPLSTLT